LDVWTPGGAKPSKISVMVTHCVRRNLVQCVSYFVANRADQTLDAETSAAAAGANAAAAGEDHDGAMVVLGPAEAPTSKSRKRKRGGPQTKFLNWREAASVRHSIVQRGALQWALLHAACLGSTAICQLLMDGEAGHGAGGMASLGDQHEIKREDEEGVGDRPPTGRPDGRRESLPSPREDESAALFVACARGYPDVVKLLLDRKADPSARACLGEAARNGHGDVVEMLLSSKATRTLALRGPTAESALVASCEIGDEKSVRALLRYSKREDPDSRVVDPARNASEALHEACVHGHAGVVELLLVDGRAKPSDRGARALIAAASVGHAGIVSMMLAAESAKDFTISVLLRAVRGAAKKGQAAVCSALLAHPRLAPIQAVASLAETSLISPGDRELPLYSLLFDDSDVTVAQVALQKPGQSRHDEETHPAAGDMLAPLLHMEDGQEAEAILLRRMLLKLCSRKLGDPATDECARILKALLDDGRVDPAFLDSLSLRVAARIGNIVALEMLLSDKRADPLALKGQCLVDACMELDAVDAHKILVACNVPAGHQGGVPASAAGTQPSELVFAERWGSWDLFAKLSETRIEVPRSSRLEVVESLLADERLGSLADPAVDLELCLGMACALGNAQVLLALLPSCGETTIPSAAWGRLLRAACHNNHAEVVRVLVSADMLQRADPMDEQGEIFVRAAGAGNLRCVRELMASPRTDPAVRGSAALVGAICGGHMDVVRLLLSDGRCDPRAGDGEPLIAAVRTGRLDLIRMLLEDGRARPSQRQWAVLHEAIEDIDDGKLLFEIVSLMLAHDGSSPHGMPASGADAAPSAAATLNVELLVAALKRRRGKKVIALLRDDPRMAVTEKCILTAIRGGPEKLVLCALDSPKAIECVTLRCVCEAARHGYEESVKVMCKKAESAPSLDLTGPAVASAIKALKIEAQEESDGDEGSKKRTRMLGAVHTIVAAMKAETDRRKGMPAGPHAGPAHPRRRGSKFL
jgi:hypothetical protein